MSMFSEAIGLKKKKKSKGKCMTRSIPFVMIPYAPIVEGGDKAENFIKSMVSSLFSGILISENRPRSITHSKQANWKIHQFPGGQMGVPEFGSFSEKKISFEIKFAEKNRGIWGGVTTKLKALESLVYPTAFDTFSPTDRPALGKFTDIFPPRFSPPFTPPPKVLYWYGTGSMFFLPYWVIKLDWTTSHENTWGAPQFVQAKFDLLLDEDSGLFRMEQFFRRTMATLESLKGANKLRQLLMGSKKEKKNKHKRSSYITSGFTGNKKIDREINQVLRF